MPAKSDYQPVNLAHKFSLFSEQWSQKIIAEMNDYQFKLARLQGEFIWYTHTDTDETFIIVDGELRIEFRDGTVTLRAGEMYVVPKGKEHKPVAEQEVKLLLVEPRGTPNTGDQGGERTTPGDEWI